MTPEEIIEGNKLIAEFMGLPKTQLYSSPGIKTFMWRNPKTNDLMPVSYHSSWDWLMPVVERIQKAGFRTKLTYDEYSFHCFLITEGMHHVKSSVCSAVMIEAVYETVLEFISNTTTN